MKIVADFPAFDIVDLEQDVIVLEHSQLKNHLSDSSEKFCVAKETRRHGTLYPEVSPYCTQWYALDYNECPKAAVERCTELKHEIYWINNCASSITSHQRAKGRRILLKPGQKVDMDGVILEVYRKGNSDHYGFKKIS